MTHLLHPEILESSYIGGNLANQRLEARADEVAANPLGHQADEGVSLVIRTRNNVANLEHLYDEMDQQDMAGRIEVILVDTESSDGTAQEARRRGAQIISITQDDFSYPVALNKGFEAASYNAVFSTVGHANFALRQTLPAAIGHVANGVAGASGESILGANASRTEKLTFTPAVLPNLKGVRKVTKPEMGLLGACNAVFSKTAWEDLGGFDEAFAAGGEDTDLAKRMLAADYDVRRDPALSMHHTHGLGPINTVKQWIHWAKVLRGPSEFDVQAVAKRRPDLDLSAES